MLKDDVIRVRHALDAARKALLFVDERSREDLETDEMLSLSLVRLLEILGEAAYSVSEDFREKYPSIPWKKMVGMRNRLIHGYFDVNLEIVWDTVTEDLPPLALELEKVIESERNAE